MEKAVKAVTLKQKQHLLGYLGYYRGVVDGIWGRLSRQAVEEFQREYGLDADGVFGEKTRRRILEVIAGEAQPQEGDFWQEIEFFDREEFRCTCAGRGCGGFPAEPSERLVRNGELARSHFGAPATVSSGVRCVLRNRELPGSAANSLHLSGRAMDFAVAGVGSAALLDYVRQLPEVQEAYAIDGNYVHMGVQKQGGGKEYEG